MYNIKLVISDMSAEDVINLICCKENIQADDFFAFSCIEINDHLKINCQPEKIHNPYTVRQLITKLFSKELDNKRVRYVSPPIESYIHHHKPMLHSMVNRIFPTYQKLIPDKDDLLSTLYYVISKLHHQGYYLHNKLIYKALINELNMEVRKSKNFQDMLSLDEEVKYEETTTILGDIIPDPRASEEARQLSQFTETDFWDDLLQRIKAAMLEEMSQLVFDRILIQLESKTIDQTTSKILRKFRDRFNPGNVRRPNRKTMTGIIKPKFGGHNEQND